MHKRCSNDQNSEKDTLLIPYSQVDPLHDGRRRRDTDCTIGVVLVTRSIQFRVGHRKKNSRGNRPREASRQGDRSRRFGHEFRNIIIGRVSAHFLPRMDGKYENFYEFIITADIIVTRNAI